MSRSPEGAADVMLEFQAVMEQFLELQRILLPACLARGAVSPGGIPAQHAAAVPAPVPADETDPAAGGTDAIGVSAVQATDIDRIEIHATDFGSSDFVRVNVLEGTASPLLAATNAGATTTKSASRTRRICPISGSSVSEKRSE